MLVGELLKTLATLIVMGEFGKLRIDPTGIRAITDNSFIKHSK